MKWQRVLAIMQKEWRHIIRDRMSFILLMLSPVLFLLTLGYAFSIDIKDVKIGVLDQDLSAHSRAYVAQIASTNALRVVAWPQSLDEVESLMLRGRARAVVHIAPGFSESLTQGEMPRLQVIIDGTDPNTAGHCVRHIAAHTEDYIVGELTQWASAPAAIDLRLRAWYNPSLRYTVSLIPALLGVVLSVPAMAASLAFAREREWGTMEALIASPIGRGELLLGKLVPYVIAGFISVPLCVLVSIYGYKVSFQGDLLLYMVLSLVFLLATMSVAIFISIFSQSQQVAIVASMIIFLFSGFFMSGLLLPVSVMGPLVKLEALMFPTTHFVIISRALYVKGSGLASVWGYVVALLGIAVVFFALGAAVFKKKM